MHSSPPLRDRSDEDLFAGFQDGSMECLGEIYQRYHKRIFDFIHRVLRDPADAEDLTSRVFERVMNSRHTYDRARPLQGWLYTIAANLMKNDHRGRKRRRVLPEAEFRPRAAEGAPSVLDGAAARETPETTYVATVLRERLARVLEQLSPEYRRIFELRHLQGLSVAEVAEVTGMPAGSVKAKGTRARARVLQLMGPLLRD